MRVAALSDFVSNLSLSRFGFQPRAREEKKHDIASLCQALVSRQGEISCFVIAEEILSQWDRLSGEERIALLAQLSSALSPDRRRILDLIKKVEADQSDHNFHLLHRASEPRFQELLRRLNHARNGTQRLVRMREELIDALPAHPELSDLDKDFSHLFASWFNRGFLELKPITWRTPASVLEKIIQYEAVHAISDWDDLRRRIEPADRRLFAFFHPQMPDEPLIFVEVALTASTPARIGDVLSPKRAAISPEEATTAVFYSISNCQRGLKGISFGNFLIKQVVEELKRELPQLKTFVTLSPVPDFARWLDKIGKGESEGLTEAQIAVLSQTAMPAWQHDNAVVAAVEPVLKKAAARYFASAKDRNGKPFDSVARFHLGNGARLENIHVMADLSEKGISRSRGIMVNYLYKTDDIEKNHEDYAERGKVVVSDAVRSLLR
jgi:malonyl-CoA decarboxylase